jgi:hypothetical protein
MESLPPTLLAATGLGLLAASIALTTAVVASLRGGESTAAARRLAPLTVTPAIAALLPGTLALDGTLPNTAPLLAVLATCALLVPAVRTLWRTRPDESGAQAHAQSTD